MIQSSTDRKTGSLSSAPKRGTVGDSLLPGDALYRALLDASPNAIIVSDLNFKILFCNRQAAMLHGLDDPAKLVGHDAFARLSPQAAATAVKRARDLLRSGSADTSDTFECQIRRWDGSTFPAQISASFITDSQGKPLVFRCVVRDITERKEVEEELQNSEQRYRQLFERNLVGLYRTDLDGRILDCNDALAVLLGCESREELLGRLATDFYFDLADRQNVLRKFDERTGFTNQELKLRRKDGTAIWVLESASRIEWETSDEAAKRGARTGSAPRIVLEGTLVDITQRKRTEEALRESEERFHLVMRATNDVIYDYDVVTDHVWWNEGLQTQLGYDPTEVKADMEWWQERLHPADRQRVQSSLATAMKNGEQYWSGEYRFRRAKGRSNDQYAHILDRCYLIQNESGVPVRLIGSMVDITDRKQAELALAQSERKHRALMEQASDGIVIFDMRGNFSEVNSQACLAMGYTPQEFKNLNVLDILSPQDAGMMRSRFSDIHSGKVIIFESTLKHKDGHYFAAEISCKMLSDRRIQAICRDITGRKQSEEALWASERRYRQLFEHNLAGVYRTTFDGTVLDCNDAMVKMLGCSSRDELLGRPAAAYFADPSERSALLDRLLEQGSLANLEICYLRKDGSRMWALENISMVEGTDTHANMLEGTVIDITERKVLEEQLTHQAFHDSLTMLPNRALFMDRLEHALARASRSGELVGVLFLDLDNFKVVNDSLGHKTGDQLLMSVGQRLLTCVRAADTVARLGGDEFTLLIEDVKSLEGAIRVAQRVADALATPFTLDDRDIVLNTSVGIAISTGTEKPDDLLRNADLAMYQAKNGGKARYSVYEPSLNRRVWERLQSEMDLRRALEADELVVHYQPVVQLQTGEVVEVEALVRWQHPDRGLVPPSEFISLAEETGLIVPLGQWVLREACKQVRAWQTELPGAADLSVSVNFSPRQFRHPRLLDDIKRTLEETGLDARHLKLEITESTGLDNTESTVATLAELKEAGIQLAIDDFGTGHSALSYLKHYPIDSLKLDRSFVSGLGQSLEDTAIIHAVIAFARTLNLKVIAEGIERIDQLAQLRNLGCEWGQGYYFARPLPPQAASHILAERRFFAENRLTGNRFRTLELGETNTGRLL